MTTFELDIRGEKNGYSCVVKYNTADLCISMGGGNATYVGIVEINSLSLRVIGGEDLYNLCKAFINNANAKDVHTDFKERVIELCKPHINYQMLFRLTVDFYNDGYSDGKREMQESLRKLIGLDS